MKAKATHRVHLGGELMREVSGELFSSVANLVGTNFGADIYLLEWSGRYPGGWFCCSTMVDAVVDIARISLCEIGQ